MDLRPGRSLALWIESSDPLLPAASGCIVRRNRALLRPLRRFAAPKPITGTGAHPALQPSIVTRRQVLHQLADLAPALAVAVSVRRVMQAVASALVECLRVAV